MLSKCANPACSATFQYLHQGKIFHLCPSPAVEMAAAAEGLFLVERFWLCDDCAKEMTVIWDGARAKIVRLPPKPTPASKTLSPSCGNASIREASTRDTPSRETPLQTKPHPARLRAAFAGRRSR